MFTFFIFIDVIKYTTLIIKVTKEHQVEVLMVWQKKSKTSLQSYTYI